MAQAVHLAQARVELVSIQEQAALIKQSLSDLQAGREPSLIATSSDLHAMAKDLLLQQMALRGEIGRLVAMLSPDPGIPSPLPAAAIGPRAPSEPPRKVQKTLAGFVFLMDEKNPTILKPLAGPRVIESTSLKCSSCEKELKNIQGVTEHMRHCARAQEDEQRQREQQRALALARVGKGREQEDNSAESDADSRDGHSQGQLAGPVQGQSATVAAGPAPAKSGRRGQDARKAYSSLFKMRVIQLVMALNAERPGTRNGAQKDAADLFNLAPTTVGQWVKAADKIIVGARKMLGTRGRGNLGRLVLSAPRGALARFAAAEALVFGKFLSARKKGSAVSGLTIKTWMRLVVKQVYPGDMRAAEFKASAGWLNHFKTRHNIVTRRRTNKKVETVAARLFEVQNWHRKLQDFVSEPGGSNHPVYGRYTPRAIFNVDQSPLQLQPGAAVTLELRGATTVQIAARDSGEKRYCTLQITVSPGETQPSLMIIFRGQGARLSAQEKAAWDKRVVVEFQPKAWVDANMVEKYVKRILKPFLVDKGIDDALLFMDNLAAQQTEEVRAMYKENGIFAYFLPPNRTDMIQPVDRHLAQQVKKKMADLLDQRLVDDEVFRNEWLGIDDGTMPACDVRVALTHFAADAWEHVCAQRNFRKLFEETGCLMPKKEANLDGVACIKIHGVPDYSFKLASGSQEAVSPPPPPPPPLDDVVLISEDEGEAQNEEAAGVNHSDASEAFSPASSPPAARGRTTSSASSQDEDIEDDDALQLEVDVAADRDEIADETVDESAWGAGAPVAPSNFNLAEHPTFMPGARSLLNRKVLWAIPVTSTGAPGWIVSSVAGGPLTPTSAMGGVTMRLKCTKKMDKKTPDDLLDDHVEVAFTLANYSKRWCLLEEGSSE